MSAALVMPLRAQLTGHIFSLNVTKMKNYWIAFLTTLSIAATTVIVVRSKKESDRQQTEIALDSFIPNFDKHAPAPVQKKKRVLNTIYTKVAIDSIKLPSINAKFISALSNQMTLLKHGEDQKIGDLEVETDKMAQVVDIFRKAKSQKELSDALDAYQIKGDDQKGNVRFTGYYSPIISARRKADAVYKYPVYLAKTSKDDEMTLAYVRDRNDIHNMCMEGVAYLQFPEGDKRLVAFDGEYRKVYEEVDNDSDNGEPKKILARYTSVMTTKYEKSAPMGAAKVPLTSDITIAVDEDYIPLGSVLLAEVPILDEQGNLVRMDLRFVLAQDTGSKIRGTGHVDLYMGEGDGAKNRIKNMNKYGRVWLLLPKEKTKVLAQNL
ncbi:MAG: MltA domain-containing protein [Saprospiraceae bacterium]|nr:MltA domain-containing protein [Saprospiraceae bacterium]